MPFCLCRVTVDVTHEQEKTLSSRIGQALGHGERFLLLDVQANCHMILRGSATEDVAYIQLSIFGNEEHCGYAQLTQKITGIVYEVLGIPTENIYIQYVDIPCFGWAGSTFPASCDATNSGTP
ncbi:MAG: hypothetical protein IJU76_13750 [Desulfovibrionaceae bacterium]|nr:hypothetical protein [Desulfovibrionaceae bacterium]